jgi:hypothetical protein
VLSILALHGIGSVERAAEEGRVAA